MATGRPPGIPFSFMAINLIVKYTLHCGDDSLGKQLSFEVLHTNFVQENFAN